MPRCATRFAGLIGFLAAQSFVQAADPGASAPVTDAKPSIHRPSSVAGALLAKRVDRVEWVDVPFNEVLDWLRQESKALGSVNIIVRWRALSVESIGPDTPVSMTLRDVTVGQVLREVLEQLSDVDPIVYYIDNGILRITTRSNLRGRLLTRAYDVSEIVGQARASRVRPGIAVGQQSRVGTVTGTPGGGLGGAGETIDVGTTIFGDVDPEDDDDDDDALNAEYAQQIIDMIQSTIEPQSWQVNGGVGTIAVFNGMLVVHNSADVHAKLQGMHP